MPRLLVTCVVADSILLSFPVQSQPQMNVIEQRITSVADIVILDYKRRRLFLTVPVCRLQAKLHINPTQITIGSEQHGYQPCYHQQSCGYAGCRELETALLAQEEPRRLSGYYACKGKN